MPSTTIVTGVRRITQKQLLPQLPRKWRKQFGFGMHAYALRSFQSATGNARMVVANPNTAARNSERLLANLRLADRLGSVFDTMRLVQPDSFVNIDHSDMHEILALVGAVQTRKGRAIPCMIEATYASTIPHEGSSASTPRLKRLRLAMRASRREQSFAEHTIASLQGFRNRLGFWPRLVFDRGFGGEQLIRHLVDDGATFYIRLKEGRYVELDGQRYMVAHLPTADSTVVLAGMKLRVIRSLAYERWQKPWYVLTNDFATSQKGVNDIYYHRFEIEETFRDIKHMWELRHTKFNKPSSIKVLLWFVALGIALLYLLTLADRSADAPVNPKKKRSWLRIAFEQLQRERGWMEHVDLRRRS